MRTRSFRMDRLAAAAALAVAAGCQTTPPVAWKLPDGVKVMEANGYPLAYTEKGSGPTVVLVHGAMCDYRCWATLAEALSARHRVVSVSLRHYYPEPFDGSGDTYSIPQHAKDLAVFLSRWSPPVSVVAHSYGGAVAVEAARQNPGLVGKLVLAEAAMDSLMPPRDAAWLEGRKKFADAAENMLKTKGPQEAMEFGVDLLNGKGTYASYPAAIQAIHRDNAWTLIAGARAPIVPLATCAEFGALKMPVLLTTGENTSQRYKQMIPVQQKCLPAAKTVVIPRVGHGMISQPAFVTAVSEFLQE